MTNQNLTPKIRFKGFSDPWEQRKFFSNVIETLDHRGKTPRKLGMDWTEKGEYLALSAINVKPGYINKKITTHYADQELYNKWMGKDAIVKGDIVLTTEAPMGNVAIIPDNKGYILSQRVIGFKLNGQITNNLFWFEYLSSSIFQNRIDSISSGGTAKGISQKTLKDINTLVPKNIEEQRHIGKLLSTVDNLIAANEYKLKQLKELKRLLMQKIFSQEWRFKGFADPWEQRKLEDFGRETGGTSLESEFKENGAYKVISIGSYSKESTYTDQGIRVDYNVKTKNRILNHADLAMILNDKTSSGDIIGRVLYIDRDNTYVYNQRTERIEPNQDIYNSYFLYQMLNAPMIRAKIIKLAQGNTQIYVNWSSVNQLLYKVPSILEQLKIVMLLKNVDTLIAANEDKHKNAFNIRRRFITSILS